MKRIAMIANGIVENIAAWDGESTWSPEGVTLVDITDLPDVQIGWLYDGTTFTDPNPPPPEE
jgi:hypothetical protein